MHSSCKEYLLWSPSTASKVHFTTPYNRGSSLFTKNLLKFYFVFKVERQLLWKLWQKISLKLQKDFCFLIQKSFSPTFKSHNLFLCVTLLRFGTTSLLILLSIVCIDRDLPQPYYFNYQLRLQFMATIYTKIPKNWTISVGFYGKICLSFSIQLYLLFSSKVLLRMSSWEAGGGILLGMGLYFQTLSCQSVSVIKL